MLTWTLCVAAALVPHTHAYGCLMDAATNDEHGLDVDDGMDGFTYPTRPRARRREGVPCFKIGLPINFPPSNSAWPSTGSLLHKSPAQRFSSLFFPLHPSFSLISRQDKTLFSSPTVVIK